MERTRRAVPSIPEDDKVTRQALEKVTPLLYGVI